MTRTEIRANIRLLAVLEDTNVTDAEINTIINEGLHWVDGFYPYPVSIVELATDGATPAFAEEFHWILVNWGIAQLMQREEYYAVSEQHMEKVNLGVREMVKFYTGGRT